MWRYNGRRAEGNGRAMCQVCEGRWWVRTITGNPTQRRHGMAVSHMEGWCGVRQRGAMRGSGVVFE